MDSQDATTHRFWCTPTFIHLDDTEWTRREVRVPGWDALKVYTEDDTDTGVSSLGIRITQKGTTLHIDSKIYHAEMINDSIPWGSVIAHAHLLRDHLIPHILSELGEDDLASYGPLLRQIGVDEGTTCDLLGRGVLLKDRPELTAALDAAWSRESRIASGATRKWEVAEQDDYQAMRGSVWIRKEP